MSYDDAMAAKRRSGPSGKHVNPLRQLSQTPEEWEAQDALAAARGMSWAQWARATLERARKRAQGSKRPGSS